MVVVVVAIIAILIIVTVMINITTVASVSALLVCELFFCIIGAVPSRLFLFCVISASSQLTENASHAVGFGFRLRRFGIGSRLPVGLDRALSG